MSKDDRRHWDRRHAEAGMEPTGRPPPVFAGFERLFPVEGRALEIACGRGATVVWLAGRGMEVLGVDVSPVAIDLARELALLNGVDDRCRSEVHDLDEGLPAGRAVDLLLCHMFRDRRLDQPMMERLAPGGLLAVAALSEVGGGSGQFRAVRGELRVSFEPLEVIAEGEGDGVAWFIGRRPDRPSLALG
ncbi:MAG: class I SAM-dependent methyltransferase [Acidimicrobiia bacterium]